MAKFRKIPVEIEAVQYDGTNGGEIERFVNGDIGMIGGTLDYDPIGNDYFIKTLEGKMTVRKDDYIIKGVKGEFYPCKPDIFHKTYEQVGE